DGDGHGELAGVLEPLADARPRLLLVPGALHRLAAGVRPAEAEDVGGGADDEEVGVDLTERRGVRDVEHLDVGAAAQPLGHGPRHPAGVAEVGLVHDERLHVASLARWSREATGRLSLRAGRCRAWR